VARDRVDGFYVAPRDVEALKQKMRYFYDHREEIARMGGNASQWAQRFSWDRFSRQIADVILARSGREYGNVEKR
jgi:glycosyltransferase involved in cell wall biosynthesis